MYTDLVALARKSRHADDSAKASTIHRNQQLSLKPAAAKLPDREEDFAEYFKKRT